MRFSSGYRRFLLAMCASLSSRSRNSCSEVEVSPRRRQDEAALNAFLGYVEVLDLPDVASPHYAQILAALRALGTMIGANDLFIAAHARSLGLTLVTNNAREFERVPKLAIENWTTVL